MNSKAPIAASPAAAWCLVFAICASARPASSAGVSFQVATAESGLQVTVNSKGSPPRRSSAAFNERCAGDALEIGLVPSAGGSVAPEAVLRLVQDSSGLTRLEGNLPLPRGCGKLAALRIPYTWDTAGVTAAVSESSSVYEATVHIPVAVLAWLFPESSSDVMVSVRLVSAGQDSACAVQTIVGAGGQDRLAVRLPSAAGRQEPPSPLLRAVAAYIRDGPQAAAALLRAAGGGGSNLPAVALMSDLAGDAQAGLSSLTEFAAQPGVPDVAREWAQLERARILARIDGAAAREVLLGLKATAPSNVATAQAMLSELNGEDVTSRLLSLVEPECGPVSQPGLDQRAFGQCVARTRAVAPGHKAAILKRLQEDLLRSGQPLTAFRVGSEALSYATLGRLWQQVLDTTILALQWAPLGAEERNALAVGFIQNVTRDSDFELQTLRALERRGFADLAREARAALEDSLGGNATAPTVGAEEACPASASATGNL